MQHTWMATCSSVYQLFSRNRDRASQGPSPSLASTSMPEQHLLCQTLRKPEYDVTVTWQPHVSTVIGQNPFVPSAHRDGKPESWPKPHLEL